MWENMSEDWAWPPEIWKKYAKCSSISHRLHPRLDSMGLPTECVFRLHGCSCRFLERRLLLRVCLARDHADVGVQQPTSCVSCRPHPLVRRHRQWDHFRCFDVSLQCDESKAELVIDGVKTSALKCPTPPPFITSAEMEASPPEDDDSISSVSATSTSHRSAQFTGTSRRRWP